MTYERQMKLDVVGRDGVLTPTPFRRLRWIARKGWVFEIKMSSYLHIPLALWFDLKPREPYAESYDKPGPYLVLSGLDINVFTIEVLDLKSSSDSEQERHPTVFGIGDDDAETPLEGREFRATFAQEDRASIQFQVGPKRRPQVKVEGPYPNVSSDSGSTRALLPYSIPRSPHQLSVDFREATLGLGMRQEK